MIAPLIAYTFYTGPGRFIYDNFYISVPVFAIPVSNPSPVQNVTYGFAWADFEQNASGEALCQFKIDSTHSDFHRPLITLIFFKLG